MEVLAKFKCESIVDCPEYENKNVTFSAVVNNCKENKSFSKYTPAGMIQMSISYETPALTAFEEGEEYFVTFNKVLEDDFRKSYNGNVNYNE